MNINMNNDDAIIMVVIGICIGIGLGFLIKTIVDTYILVNDLPI